MSSRRTLAGLLFLSLAINVFLAAYWAASITRSRMGLMRPAPVSMAYRIAERLPEPASTSLKARLDGLKPEIDRQVSLYNDALARGASQLEQDDLNQVELEAAIDEARNHRGRIGDALTDAFISTVAEQPPETRRRLVQRFMDHD